MMAITAFAGRFAPIASLVSADAGAKVVEAAGRFYLDGLFCLDLCSQNSARVQLTAVSQAVEVAQQGAEWRILRLSAPLTFDFTAQGGFHGGAVGAPRLAAPRVRLVMVVNDLWMVLDDVAISSLGGIDPTIYPKQFVFPTTTGGPVSARNLAPWASPGKPMGFPIEIDAEGFWVRSGDRSGATNFNHVPEARVAINGRAKLSFLLADKGGRQAASIRFLTGVGPDDMLVQLGANMKLSGRTFGGAEGEVRPKEVRISGALLEISSYLHDELTGTYMVSGTPMAVLRGAADQFRLLLPIPPNGAVPPAQRRAQLAFTDNRVAADREYSDHRQRFYGLNVPTLASTRTSREVFDCSLATSTWDNGGFVLRAGMLLDILDDATPRISLLRAKRQKPKAQGGKRLLQETAGSMRLEVSDARPDLKFEANGNDILLTLPEPELRGPPLGAAAASRPEGGLQFATENETYSDWILRRPEPLVLGIAGQVRPIEKGNWPERFRPQTQAFSLLESAGTGMVLQREATAFAKGATTATTIESKLVIDYKTGALVVAGAAGALIFTRIHCGDFDAERCFKTDDIRFNVETFKGTDYKDLKKFVEGHASDDLRLLYGGETADGIEALHDFVDDNIGKPGNSGKFVYGNWPFAMGLGLLMRTEHEDGRVEYCDQIVRSRYGKSAPVTSIGFDFSEIETLPVQKLFGNGATWQIAAQSANELWPRAGTNQGMRFDPSFSRWTGVFFRNMPLFIAPPKGVIEKLDKFPILKGLYELLNQSLFLEYGWHDAHGTTWYAKLRYPDEATTKIQFTPPAWNNVLELSLLSAESKGAQGAIVGGSVKVEAKLPCIQVEGAGGRSEALVLEGDFAFDVTSPNVLSEVTISSPQPIVATRSIPGFSHVRVASIGTDWVTAKCNLELVAGTELSAAIPALASSAKNPIKASLTFNLSGQPGAEVDLVLPKPIKSHLFGKFPITVEGIKLALGGTPQLAVRCRVDLGLPGLQDWQLRVTVAGNGAVAVEVEGINGKIDFGELELEGSLAWQDKEFIGSFAVSGGVMSAEKQASATMVARVGAHGDRSFWVSGLRMGKIGITQGAQIEEPVLLLSHAMDYDGGKFYGALTNIAGSLTALRPSNIGQGWLKTWNFDPKVGTGFAASGFLKIDDTVAPSTKDQPLANEKYLSSFVITDDGRVRADAWLSLFGTLNTRFVVAVDLKNKIMSAGMQLPEMQFPPKEPKVEVAPGFVSLTIGYGSKTQVRVSVGWPEKIGNTEFERDWSKSTRIKIDDLKPLNTFWGGWLLEYSNKLGGVRFGYAIRAGWTKKYAFDGAGIASAEAELGVALGGVFVFAIYEKPLYYSAPELPAGKALGQLQIVASAASASIGNALVPQGLAKGWDACAKAELYGDIWGRGSAKFMGVTVASIDFALFIRFRVCGSLEGGITSCWGRAGFKVTVKIGCFSYSAWAETDVVMISGSCPPGCADDVYSLARPATLPLLPQERLA